MREDQKFIYLLNECFYGMNLGNTEAMLEKVNELIKEHKCEACGELLWGEPIPPSIRHLYNNKLFFSRKIAIYNRDYDRVVAFKCPDCQHEWRRVYP